jgi:hypothetical protein
VDFRSRANTTRALDFEHMIKTRAHKGDMRIGEKHPPKKKKKKTRQHLISSMQRNYCRNFKATEANRRR